MTWNDRRMLRGTLAAFAAAGVVAALSDVPFAAAAASLLFAWPVADAIIERIAARVPGADRRVAVRVPRWIAVAQLALWVAFSAVVSATAHLSIIQSLAIVLVVLAPVGAVLGIVAEWEDSRAGGFDNPRIPSPEASPSTFEKDPCG